MKYFTPALYIQFNSDDPAVAERADEEWDKAEVAYKARLESIRERMPSQVARLAGLCLHDAEILSREEQTQALGGSPLQDFPALAVIPWWSATALVSVVLNGQITSLIYALSDHMSAVPAPEEWRFSKLQEHWLYDEVDCLNDRGAFVHRILLSTGITVTIPFTSVIVHQFAAPLVKRSAKQIA